MGAEHRSGFAEWGGGSARDLDSSEGHTEAAADWATHAAQSPAVALYGLFPGDLRELKSGELGKLRGESRDGIRAVPAALPLGRVTLHIVCCALLNTDF